MHSFKQKRILSLVSGLLSAIISLQAQSQDLADIKWQQSAAQIKQQHSQAPAEETQRALSYPTQLFDLDFNQEYIFANDKLIEVLYYHAFKAEADNCLQEYRQVKGRLEQLYGQVATAVNTQLDTDKLSEQAICQASSKGQYFLDSRWQHDNTNIGFVLSTWKGQSYLGVTYQPLKQDQ